jgi:hypothetical protein
MEYPCVSSFHPDQSRRAKTQKSLSNAASLGRGCVRFSAASCWRRARFSRRSSFFYFYFHFLTNSVSNKSGNPLFAQNYPLSLAKIPSASKRCATYRRDTVGEWYSRGGRAGKLRRVPANRWSAADPAHKINSAVGLFIPVSSSIRQPIVAVVQPAQPRSRHDLTPVR